MATQNGAQEPLIAMGVLQSGQIPEIPVIGPIQKEPLLKTLLRCKLEKRLQLIEQLICSRY